MNMKVFTKAKGNGWTVWVSIDGKSWHAGNLRIVHLHGDGWFEDDREFRIVGHTSIGERVCAIPMPVSTKHVMDHHDFGEIMQTGPSKADLKAARTQAANIVASEYLAGFRQSTGTTLEDLLS